MPDTRDAGDLIRAAEAAATGGDYTSAGRLLREAAAVQEATLGPLHPDLANTLNNLGVVSELTQQLDDAEAYFRRAHEIAVASLPPEHPFVGTSRKNLDDFCTANNRPLPPPVTRHAVESSSRRTGTGRRAAGRTGRRTTGAGRSCSRAEERDAAATCGNRAEQARAPRSRGRVPCRGQRQALSRSAHQRRVGVRADRR
jgi:hypothetical protein